MEEFLEYINNSLPSSLVDAAIRILGALLIIAIGFRIGKSISKRLAKVTKTRNLDESTFSFVKSFINIAIKAIVLFTAAAVLGVPLTAIVTLLGSAGLAIGLALQGSLSNLAGGIMLLIFRPFSLGDYISNHDDEGTVISIGIFYTTLRTPDNRTVVIPNGSLTNGTIINYSAYEQRRLDVEFRIAYDSDMQKALEIIRSVATECEGVDTSKPVNAFLLRQETFGNVLCCRVWCSSDDLYDIKAKLMNDITEAFCNEKIQLK